MNPKQWGEYKCGDGASEEEKKWIYVSVLVGAFST